jgi:hypothetical protein
MFIYSLTSSVTYLPTSVAEWSKAWVYDLSLAGIAGLNPFGVSCECCFFLSGGGLCDGPIPHPEESY